MSKGELGAVWLDGLLLGCHLRMTEPIMQNHLARHFALTLVRRLELPVPSGIDGLAGETAVRSGAL